MWVTWPDGRGYTKNSKWEVVVMSELDWSLTSEWLAIIKERAELIDLAIKNEEVWWKENNSDLH